MDDVGRVLHNVTQDPHIFHNPAQTGCPNLPGQPEPTEAARCSQVRRDVVVSESGAISVRTTGTGIGPFADQNESFGEYIFGRMDDFMVNAAREATVVYAGGHIADVILNANSNLLQCEDD